MPAFEDETRSDTVCTVLVRLRDQVKQVGMAFFSPSSREFSVCEFIDNDHLSILEAAILQTTPKQCYHFVVPAVTKRVKELLEGCDVGQEEVKSVLFKTDSVEQDLERLLEDGVKNHLQEVSMQVAMPCLAALIDRTRLLADHGNFGACRLKIHLVDAYMRLDKASFSALQLLPRPGDGVRVPTSVLGFLNRCRTAVGSRRLTQWVTQPLVNPEELGKRHDIVELFVNDEPFRQAVVNRHLSSVPDLDRLLARFRNVGRSTGTSAGLEDMVRLYQCLLGTDKLHRVLLGYMGAHRDVLEAMITRPLGSCLKDFHNFFALVEQTVDLDEASKGNYIISSAFEPSFKALEQRKKELWAQVEALAQQVQSKLGLGAGKDGGVRVVEATGGQGWAFRVTKKQQKTVQSKPGMRTVQLNKGEFLFTNPAMEKLVRQVKEVDDDYQTRQSALVQKALQVAATYHPVLERLAAVFATLDVLTSFALVSISSKGSFVRAKIDPTNKVVDLRGARHVLVEEVTDGAFIKNDVVMDRESSRMFVITGPNMGGKSTFIRMVALVSLMNQVGCFVPCDSATLPLFSAVMCRVGASDLQLRGVSTFMAEMLEASCIVQTATPTSLVLVDELGRGTSTYDGFGLAWAIADHLATKVSCFSLFATHFHEVAALADVRPCVVNKHVRALTHKEKLTFLYEVREGFADQSYGVHVAEMARFPEHLVTNAKRKAEQLETGSKAANKRFRGEAGEMESLAEVLAASDVDDLMARFRRVEPALRAAVAC